MANAYSPIQSVTPVDVDGNVTGATITDIPTPSSYLYTLIDVSDSEAGRVETMKMIKMRKGQAVRIDIEWAYPTFEDCAKVLTAFNPEYIKVNYFDGKANAFLDKIFYVGDRKSPMWSKKGGRWESVGFGIIQQVPDAT